MSDDWNARAFEIALWLIVGLAIDLGRTGRPAGKSAADMDPYAAHSEAVVRLCEAHRTIALAIMEAGPDVTPWAGEAFNAAVLTALLIKCESSTE